MIFVTQVSATEGDSRSDAEYLMHVVLACDVYVPSPMSDTDRIQAAIRQVLQCIEKATDE